MESDPACENTLTHSCCLENRHNCSKENEWSLRRHEFISFTWIYFQAQYLLFRDVSKCQLTSFNWHMASGSLRWETAKNASELYLGSSPVRTMDNTPAQPGSSYMFSLLGNRGHIRMCGWSSISALSKEKCVMVCILSMLDLHSISICFGQNTFEYYQTF